MYFFILYSLFKILKNQTERNSFISPNVSRWLGESLIKSYCGWSSRPTLLIFCLIAGHHRSHTHTHTCSF